ncbi:GHMP kinase, partial [Chloroflexota bacterium]
MILRSKAPLRISFGGGGTDVSPYPEEHGGAILSATICKYTYVSLISRPDDKITAQSLDYDTSVNYEANGKMTYDGQLDLVKAATKVLKIEHGCDLFLHSDAPLGSGLGSSSSLVVALVGLLREWQRLPLTPYEIAEIAYHIEREELGIKGGKQDQYAAAFGGFNFIEFLGESTIVNPLRIRDNIINELEYRMILCDSGKRRASAGIIVDQVDSYLAGTEKVVHALHKTKDLAIAMKKHLLRDEIDEFGALLNEAWLTKKQFSDKITDPYIDELYEVAMKNGAIGGKLLGAGGGGYLLFLCKLN